MKTLSLALAAGTLTAALAGALSNSSAIAAPYKHVLLISVDGMHAIDLANYVAANPTSTLAALAHTGMFYPNALASAPSDSFPGMLAQVTGGTPKSTGVFYDDSYDRTYFAPASDCKGAPGAEVAFAENIDVDSDQPRWRRHAGRLPQTQIDPKKLPMTLIDGKCAAVYPHAFVRVNNVFEIVKAARRAHRLVRQASGLRMAQRSVGQGRGRSLRSRAGLADSRHEGQDDRQLQGGARLR